MTASSARAQTPRQEIARAEQARDSSRAGLAPILKSLNSRDPNDQRRAVRALGRLGQPSLVTDILPLLKSRNAAVRAETSNALAQAVSAVPRDGKAAASDLAALDRVRQVLLAQVRTESDPLAAGAAAESLGRLPLTSPEQLADSEAAIAHLLPPPAGTINRPMRVGAETGTVSVHPDAARGALKGLDALARLRAPKPSLAADSVARVRALTGVGAGTKDAALAQLRRLALQVLATLRQGERGLLDDRMGDDDEQVRRLAMLIAAQMSDGSSAGEAIARGLKDPQPMVRVEALRAYGRHVQPRDCAPTVGAAADANPHVALQAIDLLGDGCPAGPPPLPTLLPLVDGTARQSAGLHGRWQHAAHALVALARVSPEDAAPRIARAATAPLWQVRMYAARAAAAIGDVETLRRLASDREGNVKEAALIALASVQPAATTEPAIAALRTRDYQVVLAAARALKGIVSASPAVPALLAAFERLTAERRQTSRDPRMAVLDRLEELGTPALAPKLEGCASDVDPMVAQRCGALRTRWGGRADRAASGAGVGAASQANVEAGSRRKDGRTIDPALLERRTLDEVTAGRLEGARLRVTIENGGVFEMRLLTEEAPGSVARIVSLARRGYYDGLTFHRVVSNFIVQGGSPGANEYVGDAMFMRDEPGASNVRGTVGVSSRGRDTGDAQFYINTVDNTRLDHEYTVFGEIVAGLDAVDAIVEGDVIHRIELVRPTRGS